MILYRATYQSGRGLGRERNVRDTDLSTLVVDHIVKSCNTQDVWASVMILDAIIARTRVILASSTDIWLVSDNAKTYQNDLIPVIAPFICRAYGFRQKGFLHPETARGKSLVGAHFEIAMRQVHKYGRRHKGT